MERAQVLGSLCEGTLRDVIVPDVAMRPDPRCFEEHDKPAVLRTFSDLTPHISLESLSQGEKNTTSEHEKEALRFMRISARDAKVEQQRQQSQPIVLDALHRATRGKSLVIACFYREAHTIDLLLDALREAFQLKESEPWPSQIVVLTRLIPNSEIVQPLEEIENKRRTGKEIAAWRDQKMIEWRGLLQETFQDYKTRSDTVFATIIELDKKTHIENNNTKITPDRRSIHSVIREACSRLNVLSQMIVTPNKLVNVPQHDSGTKGKVRHTVQDITTRQVGGIYDNVSELYRRIGIDGFGKDLSTSVDVITLSFCTTITGVRYCLATRLRVDGTIDILLPELETDWMPYNEAGPLLGQIFSHTKRDCVRDGKIYNATGQNKPNKARMTSDQLSRFTENLLTKKLERPTVVIVEAEKWRTVRDNGGSWWQLQNPFISRYQDNLVFGHKQREAEQRCYSRTHVTSELTHGHLLGIIRLRATETPQYVTNRADWQSDDVSLMRNYFALTGFVDQTTTELFHYFSIGQLPMGAGEPQHKKKGRDPFKIVSGLKSGGGVAYRHPPMIEMVPFFVHPDFDNLDGKATLCRIPHYLRFSPAWAMGNLDSPYPLHLGDALIEDHICILGLGDD